MKNILIIILSLFSLSCYSQKSETAEIIKLADSSLIKWNPKIIVLKENDEVLAIVTQKSFIKSCKAYSANWKIVTSKDLLKCIENNKSAIIVFEKLNIEEDLKNSYDEIFQSLILENKCLVYNKQLKKLEKNLISDFYDVKKMNFGLEYKTESNVTILKTESFSCF